MLFDETVKWRILRRFFEKPESDFYVKELTRELKISSGSASRICKELETEGLLQSEEKGRALFYSLKEGPLARRLKSAWFLERIMESHEIWENEEFQSVALYGSRASGEFISRSDVDILVISNVKGAGRDFEKLKQKWPNLTVTVFSLAEWRKLAKEKDRFYIETISNHILLYGSSLVIG